MRLGPMGGWKSELEGLYFFGAIALILLGGGRYARLVLKDGSTSTIRNKAA